MKEEILLAFSLLQYLNATVCKKEKTLYVKNHEIFL